MPYSLPELLPLWQPTTDLYLPRRRSNTVLSQLCGVPGSWCPQGLLEPSEHLWWEWCLILSTNSPLLSSCWGFSFALGRGGISSQLLHCLPSYWGFSDLGHGVSPHGRSSEAQPRRLTLDMGYLFTSAPAKHRNPLEEME